MKGRIKTSSQKLIRRTTLRERNNSRDHVYKYFDLRNAYEQSSCKVGSYLVGHLTTNMRKVGKVFKTSAKWMREVFMMIMRLLNHKDCFLPNLQAFTKMILRFVPQI